MDGKTTPRVAPREEDGVALVLALLFIVLLTALVVDLGYEMQVEASIAGSRDSDLQAYIAAKSAVSSALGLLSADVFFGEEEAEIRGVSVYDSFDDEWAEGVPLVPINDAVMQCAIADEYGKINLNALIYLNDSGEEVIHSVLVDAVRAFFDGMELDENPVDAILDWLDSDDEELEFGAENEYYTGLENPYTCKNGPMDSIEELLLIPGITPEVYFGNPEEDELPFEAFFTVHGHPEGKVNANTAQFEVLASMVFALGQPSPAEVAEEMILSREEEGPFSGLEDFRQFGLVRDDEEEQQQRREDEDEEDDQGRSGDGRRPDALDVFDWTSSTFRLRGDGQSSDAQVRIEAYVWRDTHDSGSEQMFRILDWRIIR